MTRYTWMVAFLLVVAAPDHAGAADCNLPSWLQPAHRWPATEDGLRDVVARGQDSVYDEPLVTDRPDFTEASSTVGRGVAQIEMGYTFAYDDNEADGAILRAHNTPEVLLRYGITDCVELRLFWNYFWERTVDAGTTVNLDGAQDLVIGTKIDLLTECGWRPETAVVLQLGAPTGGRSFSTDHWEAGVNFLYSWSLPHDWSLGGSTGGSTSTELSSLTVPPATILQLNDRHNVWSQSVALGIPVTEQVGFYIEYFGLYSDGLVSDFPAHFVDGGFTYLFDNNTQFDIRAGHGINRAAEDFFGGVGLSKRF